ncbi:MAG: hypothetical protein EP330_02010 [Deltaproteobacteria bacterium]|nr:MAG: hypothetical protein EP330_02010 [Deltaproteobacteria bacterium]
MRALLLALVLAAGAGFSTEAQAQDWEKVYVRARTANYVSYAAPAAGLGLGIPMFVRATHSDNFFETLLLAAGGSLAITGGMVAGGPLQAWSGMRGARALEELGRPVSRVPGTLSWAGSGLSATSMVVFLTAAGFDVDELIGPSLVGVIGGFALGYGAGLAQWTVNRKAWRNRDVPVMLRVGGAF